MLEEMYLNVDMDMIPKFAKLTGVSFGGKQEIVKTLTNDAELQLKRDYANIYDKNAIGVYSKDVQVGWIPKYLAVKLAPEIDAGIKWHVIVKEVTGQDKDMKGVNVELICDAE